MYDASSEIHKFSTLSFCITLSTHNMNVACTILCFGLACKCTGSTWPDRAVGTLPEMKSALMQSDQHHYTLSRVQQTQSFELTSTRNVICYRLVLFGMQKRLAGAFCLDFTSAFKSSCKLIEQPLVINQSQSGVSQMLQKVASIQSDCSAICSAPPHEHGTTVEGDKILGDCGGAAVASRDATGSTQLPHYSPPPTWANLVLHVNVYF